MLYFCTEFGLKMKFIHLKHILSGLCALLCFSIIVPAQVQLPVLPVDGRIQKGTLGSGVTYYMVTNPQVKGYAHIAIVQRDEPLSAAKREGLQSAFFARMGIAPGPEGFLQDQDGSTVYRFPDVAFYRPEVLDSTLLYTFSQVAASKAEQAVIVSGDIDAVELKKKMDIFSMMVPRMLVKENHRPDYVWEPSPAPVVHFYPEGKAQVRVTYSGARIPFGYMNTAQSIVSGLFGEELGVLVRHRVERNLRDQAIAHGPVGFQVLSSENYGGDERYTVSVCVEKDQQDAAMRVISSTLAEMDAFGVAAPEFVQAKQVLSPRLHRQAENLPSARQDLDRCIANFLYGASLAPGSEPLRYFSRKNVADTTEARLFNGFSSALLEQLSNLTLEYVGVPDSLEKKDDALFYYNLAYLYGSVSASGKDYLWHSADTSGLEITCPKVRLKNEKAEAVTGGVLWTFSNGMRVIYKRVPGARMFSYALQMGGGLSQVKDLREGEGGYIGDLLFLYDVGGIPAPAFRDILAGNGISMTPGLSLNSFSLSGDLPSDRLTLLLKVLLHLANDRSQNITEYQQFVKSQQIVGARVEDVLYARLHPDYPYAETRNPSVLSPDTRAKAEAFFEDRFCRMNDGILILSGGLSEEAVKKQLLKYLGGFRVLRGTTARRPVTLPTVSGVTTYTGEEGPSGICLLMDAAYPITASHFYTSQVAVDLLRQSLARHLAGYGYSAEVSVDFLFHPQERIRLLVKCTPLPLSSLPSDVAAVTPERAVTALRAALRDASMAPVDKKDLAQWKAKLSAQVKAVMATPEGFTHTLLTRYSSNKDLTSRYAESISGITAADVQTLLAALYAGGRIEYLVP